MPASRTDSRWIRAILFGLLAEFVTIICVILVVTTHSVATGGPLADTTSPFAIRWAAIVGTLGGVVFVFLFAKKLGGLLSSKFVAHGIAVAGGAVLFHLFTTVGAGQAYDVVHMGADALKLVAGALGGWLASRDLVAPAQA